MGVFATAIYDVRNMGKVSNGDTGRVGAVAAQTTNLINAATTSNVAPLKNGAQTVLKGVDNVGSVFGFSDAAAGVTKFASKAVNPLLCVGAGVRVLKDDDQYAALVEEGAAMGTMFASEKLFKKLVANPLAGQEIKTTSKWATNIAKKVANFAGNLKGKKKTAALILADLALVGISIVTYDIGKNVGKKFSNREEKTKNANPFSSSLSSAT